MWQITKAMEETPEQEVQREKEESEEGTPETGFDKRVTERERGSWYAMNQSVLPH